MRLSEPQADTTEPSNRSNLNILFTRDSKELQRISRGAAGLAQSSMQSGTFRMSVLFILLDSFRE